MIALALLAAAPLQAPAQACPDGRSPDEVVSALYRLVTVPPGGAWDWERIGRLFHGDGLLVSVVRQKEQAALAASQVVGLRRRTETAFAATGFIEREYRRETKTFGDFASVYSSFSVAVPGRKPDPLARGLNHFQLARADGCWRIVANVSMMEGNTWRLPAEFAPADGSKN